MTNKKTNATTTQTATTSKPNTEAIITAENLQTIGERIAIRALKTCYDRGAQPFIYQLYCNLIADIREKKREQFISKTDKTNPLTDGYDIAQTACEFLCEYIGKNLDDTTTDGQIDKDGNPITIKRACFRAVNRYIMHERQQIYKKDYIDDIDENGNTLYYELPKFWDTPTAEDYKIVVAKIAEMRLSVNEKKFLNYRLRGYSLEKIAPLLGVKRDTLNTYRKRLIDKAQKIGLSPTKKA